jgi:hypothetical protein
VEGAEDRDAAVRLVEDAAGDYLAVDSAQHGSLPVLLCSAGVRFLSPSRIPLAVWSFHS